MRNRKDFQEKVARLIQSCWEIIKKSCCLSYALYLLSSKTWVWDGHTITCLFRSLYVFFICLSLAVCMPVQRATAHVILVNLSHKVTLTAASLASNTPEMQGRRAERRIKKWKEQEWYTEIERKWMCVCGRCVSKGPLFPQRSTVRETDGWVHGEDRVRKAEKCQFFLLNWTAAKRPGST